MLASAEDVELVDRFGAAGSDICRRDELRVSTSGRALRRHRLAQLTEIVGRLLQRGNVPLSPDRDRALMLQAV